MSVSPYLIYALIDPRNGEPRYVGKSTSGLARPKRHAFESVKEHRPGHKANWITSLHRRGLNYSIVVLLELPDDKALSNAECFFIADFRARGFRLTNATDGGEGISGLKRTVQSKAKMARAKSGLSDEQILDIELVYVGGESVNALAKKHAVSCTAITGVLNRAGIEIRPYKTPSAFVGDALVQLLTDYASGASVGELATKNNCELKTIKKYLADNGMDIIPMRQSRIFDETELDQIRQKYEQGQSAAQIGDEFAVKRDAIYAALRKLGVPRRSQNKTPMNRNPNAIPPATVAEVIALYTGPLGNQLKKISAQTGVSVGSINDILKRHNVPKRPRVYT